MSHPRSGSHYIAALIDINFFDGNNYLRHYVGHRLGNDKKVKDKKKAIIYTWREYEATAKSLFGLRHRFGLDEDDFEKFQQRTLKNMFNSNLSVNTYVDTLNSSRMEKGVTQLFSEMDMTLKAYLEEHKRSWLTYRGKKNFLDIQYEELLKNFDKSMLKIAKFLGIRKKKFININKKIGWQNK
jgi:hypothetical protein